MLLSRVSDVGLLRRWPARKMRLLTDIEREAWFEDDAEEGD